jgi:hypothetical protein
LTEYEWLADADFVAEEVTGVRRTETLLADAARSRSFVRVTRDALGSDDLDGFVLAAGRHWSVLTVVSDGAFLDGWVAFRTADVTRVMVRVGREPFAVRALRLAGTWPPPSPAPFPIDSTQAVVAGAARAAPLVHIETEVDRPADAYIGRVVGLTADELRLLEVDAEADWDDEPSTYALDDLTRVQFGGRYEAVLYAVAGEPPPPGHQRVL